MNKTECIEKGLDPNPCSDCGEYISRYPTFGQRYMSYTAKGTAICSHCHEVRATGFKREIKLTLPPEYVFCSLNQYKKLNREQIEAFPDRTPLIAVQGCPGSGKTNLIHVCQKLLAEKGRTIVEYSVTQLKDMWLDSYQSGGVQAFQDKLKNISCLAIDDLSQAKATDGWVERFHEILEDRIKRRKPTIITFACEIDEFASLYSPAIYSRLHRFERIVLPNVDHRKKNAAKKGQKNLELR